MSIVLAAARLVVPIAAGLVVSCASFGAADVAEPRSDAGTPDGGRDDDSGTKQDAGETAYRAAVLADAPLAYFRLGEAAGSKAVTSLDGKVQGTLLAGASLGVPGALASDPDTALALDGNAAGGVSFGHVFDFTGTNPFTLEAWVKAEVIDGDYRMIFNKELDVGSTQVDMHNVYVRKGVVCFERYVKADDVTVCGAIDAKTFVHIAAVFDGASSAIFVMGVEAGRQTDTRAADPKAADFLVGRGSTVFKGTIDEIAIYDKALPAARLQAHVAAAGR